MDCNKVEFFLGLRQYSMVNEPKHKIKTQYIKVSDDILHATIISKHWETDKYTLTEYFHEV